MLHNSLLQVYFLGSLSEADVLLHGHDTIYLYLHIDASAQGVVDLPHRAAGSGSGGDTTQSELFCPFSGTRKRTGKNVSNF